jgi:copper resistance protein B
VSVCPTIILLMGIVLAPLHARAQSPHPDEAEHVIHDTATHMFVLVDQLEWLPGRVDAVAWDAKGWIGGDASRFWFRTEGEARADRLDRTETHLFYGRPVSPWWDLVAGVRTDDGPGPSRTWAAVGVQGLAPFWIELEATGYVGAAGRTHARLEIKHELLLTNRVILQPLVEVEIYGKEDPERRIGAGLSSADIGLRLRYEVRRELAAYAGVLWTRTFLGTADAFRSAGEPPNQRRLVAGLRFWH